MPLNINIPSLNQLSPRERQVFDLVVAGAKNEVVAKQLNISAKTVETHRTHINKKLNAHSTADLVRFASENGLLNVQERTKKPGVLIEQLSVVSADKKLTISICVEGVNVPVLVLDTVSLIDGTIVDETLYVEHLRRAVSKTYNNRKAA